MAGLPRLDVPLASLVVAALDDGVVVLDRDARAVLVNPAARAMGVLDVDRLAFPELAQLARRALDTGEHLTTQADLPMGRLGKEPIAVAGRTVPLTGPDEQVFAVCLLLSDVSEQRRLEAVRRDFVANVSHELKTPVGALTLLAEAIQDAAHDPDAVSRFAARIQHEGSRLARLVAELMELSRVQGTAILYAGPNQYIYFPRNGVPALGRQRWIVLQRRPHLGLRRQHVLESAWHDADDGIQVVVERDLPT